MSYKKIFSLSRKRDFEGLSLEIFNYQAKHNGVYAEYLKYLNIKASEVKSIEKIPFLPITFFKSHKVVTNNNMKSEIIFTSSGTGGMGNSKHYVNDVSVYKQSFRKSFEYLIGSPADYIVFALLPGYLERKGSSLIYMVSDLISQTNSNLSGFFLNDFENLFSKIKLAEKTQKKIILLGVSYALLDFLEQYKFDNPELIIMETGGMKGRRKEMIRKELHEKISDASGTKRIFSEYGMTELLSQAYLTDNKYFNTPPWMSVKIRDLYDPFSFVDTGSSGGINVIDLANYNSCSFIETQDLGKVFSDGSFDVLGRFDNSDIRGCNLMVE